MHDSKLIKTQLHRQILLIFALIISYPNSLFADENYYKKEPQFHTWPNPEEARYKIKRFGPIGLGLELRRPNFTIHIVNVEENSPAAATQLLRKGQIIESVNGQKLEHEDPRVLLGNWITKAEAEGGIVKLMVKNAPESDAQEVIVKIPALGAYSATWPLNCEKTNKIIRQCADYIAANKDECSIGLNGSVLFLLSTGEEKDLEVVKKWMKKFIAKNKTNELLKVYPWFAGYSGPGFCEYYLRTGDKEILPIIKKMADSLARSIYNGSWMGRGAANYAYMGGGHLNAAGLHAVTFLLMAQECGVDVDKHTLLSSLTHIFRFAGHGNVAYGDHLPEEGFTGNGKTEGLAFTLKAAANLHPDGNNSIYAKASDIAANKAFYNTSWLFHGHTGGGIGELWKGRAMGLVRNKRSKPYRSFMNERLWMYELARDKNGLFGWVSDWNVGYGDTALEKRGWGSFIPMIYTLHRKALRLHGAPPTKYSKTFPIPDRPWGNQADEIFYSLVPGEYAPGKRLDVAKELLPTHASKPLLALLKNPDVSDDVLLMYAHHFEHGIRSIVAGSINNLERFHLLPRLLSSKDARARMTALSSINSSNKKSKEFPQDEFTPEIAKLIGTMIDNPKESWWVSMAAMKAMKRAQPEQIALHFERMMEWLDHSDWWLRSAAMQGLTPLVSEPNFYRPFLSKVGEIISSSQRLGDFNPLNEIVRQLQDAPQEVKDFALQTIGESYLKFPRKLVEPGGQDLTQNVALLLDKVAGNLSQVPNGYDTLYKLARKRNPGRALPHEKILLAADPSKLSASLRKSIKPTIKNKLIPEYIEINRKNLEKELKSHTPGRFLDGLVALFQKAGITDYNWELYGPARDQIEWDYITFEPTDKKMWEQGHRFREVAPPNGCEDWFLPSFSFASSGWKKGRAPFANIDGKLAPSPLGGKCIGPNHFCGCGNMPNTFWDKEAILMRADIELPPLEDGYAYRLLVGGRSHYNAGGGSNVWFDGNLLKNKRKNRATIEGGSGRNSNKPWGITISDEQRQYFSDGKILLATNGFLRWGHKTKKIISYRSFWFEKMKLPSIDPK